MTNMKVAWMLMSLSLMFIACAVVTLHPITGVILGYAAGVTWERANPAKV